MHVNDIVQANILATINDSIDQGVYNIGSGNPVSILEVAERLIELFEFLENPQSHKLLGLAISGTAMPIFLKPLRSSAIAPKPFSMIP